MNRHLLAGAVILACLCFITMAYACVEIDVAIWDYQKFVVVTEDTENPDMVSVTAEVDYGGPATEPSWEWTWPSGLECDEYEIEENDYDSTAEFWSDTPGIYRVTAKAWNASSSYDSDWADVYVIDINLSDGGYLALNGDLMEINITLLPSNLNRGSVILDFLDPPNNKIEVYYDSAGQNEIDLPATWYVARDQVPSSIWVKGVEVSSELDDEVLEISYDKKSWSYASSEIIDIDTAQFTVLNVDLDIDTDNDGSIEESEDLIEEYSPGAILPKDLGDGVDFRKEITLVAAPTITGAEAELTCTGTSVKIWTAESGGQEVTLPKTYNAGSLPSSLWVDGITAETSSVIELTYRDSQDTVLGEDAVALLTTKTISEAPDDHTAPHVWCTGQVGDGDGEAFEDEISGDRDQGYDVTWFRDDSNFDDDFEDCTLQDYEGLGSCGAMHVISHGSPSIHFAVYADSEAACLDWIGEEDDMWVENWGPYHTVAVSSQWLSSNMSSPGYAHWAICDSASDNGNDPAVMDTAGDWAIGYWDVTNEAQAEQTSDWLLQRMNGHRDNNQFRAAGEAWDEGGFSNNVDMRGEEWTTLCPAPMRVNATWPDSDPGQRHGWGCIIFDTYIDDSLSAASALVCDSGGPISNQSWCGDTGDGKFILGFNYDNTGGGGADIRADATFCKDEGEKQMDGNRQAPNEDDRDWEY